MTPTIQQIREATRAESPYYFDKPTLKFFGQRMDSFRVWKGKSGKTYIAAPSYWMDRATGRNRLMGISLREFTGTDLATVQLPPEVEAMRSMEATRQWIKTQG